MNLENAIKNFKINRLPLIKTGYSETIKDFWTDFIEPLLPDSERVIKMFEIIKRYVNDSDAFFVIRTGNVRKDGDPKNLRRGFLTVNRTSNISYFYTDNDIATIIYRLIYDTDWDMDYDDFKNCLANRKFPVHFNPRCKEETLKAAMIINGEAPKIGPQGYKVSHIFDAGQDYLLNGKRRGLKEIVDGSFDLGDYQDWNMSKDGYYVRHQDQKIDSDVILFLKAHFLRVCCPLNYILTPKTRPISCQSCDIKIYKNDIGECPELLDYAKLQFEKKYGDVYKEYVSLLMLPDYAPDMNSGDKYVGCHYGFNINGTSIASTSKKVASSKKPIIDGIKKQLLIRFLTNNNDTYQWLDKNILKVPNDNHGASSFSIIKRMGFTTKDRGALTRMPIYDLKKISSGNKLAYLELIEEDIVK